ncbi:MAG: alpha/beta hydrolase [Ruminococcaceae bacterium]|nr:alpha/beta hydrolase [Oscillospiraceae bacterium]
MKIESYNLWENAPGSYDAVPEITAFIPDEQKSDCAVIIFPGGGYGVLCQYEGEDYAKFFNENGITAFVVTYRLTPHHFPLQLIDARRSVRFVRHHAEKFGINKDKIAVMGSSAGGHLAALVSTYRGTTEFENIDEIDKEDYLPNAQILCYPVIRLLGKGIANIGSGKSLLGEELPDLGEELSPDLIADSKTPVAFIWHTSDDDCVDVRNSLYYASKLHELGIPSECHIFPHGRHGLALCNDSPYVAKWKTLMMDWLSYIGF